MPHKLTARIYSRIINSARGYFDSNYHKSKTDIEYFRLITQKGIIACFKCGMEIKIGKEYETNHKYGHGNSRKYYHIQCYESLYQKYEEIHDPELNYNEVRNRWATI